MAKIKQAMIVSSLLKKIEKRQKKAVKKKPTKKIKVRAEKAYLIYIMIDKKRHYFIGMSNSNKAKFSTNHKDAIPFAKKEIATGYFAEIKASTKKTPKLVTIDVPEVVKGHLLKRPINDQLGWHPAHDPSHPERKALEWNAVWEGERLPNPLRIVHRSPLGGKVWRDPEHNEYRYAPAGVGPRGHRGDDVNVGFTNDLQDAIASLDATERRMTGRQKNPKQYQEWLFWMPGYETHEGYVPGMYIHITNENERQSALKYGGIDVSHDTGAWRAYDRQIDSDYDSRY